MSRTINPTANARSLFAICARSGRKGAPAAAPRSSRPIAKGSSSRNSFAHPTAASGIRTKFARSDSTTSRTLRRGATIWPTVSPSPMPSMLETTKTSVAIETAACFRSKDRVPSHRRQVAPQVRETLGATEKSREVRGVDEQNVPGATILRRHPEKQVEFRVAGGGERMQAIRVDRLPRQHLHVPV